MPSNESETAQEAIDMSTMATARAPEAVPDPVSFDFASAAPAAASILGQIEARGYAVLRNLFAPDHLAAFIESREWWFRHPAAGGVPGYCKFDYPKKVVQSSLLGAPSLRMMLDERLIDLIERYSGAPVVISESFTKLDQAVGYVYFPAHADYFQGYRSNPASGLEGLSAEQMAAPLGLSYVMYHHETSAGAFCYAAGSHLLGATQFGMISEQSQEMQAEVQRNWTRIDGQAGDVVLFDPRGIHGQDQPSHVDRYVTITRYWRTDIFGRRQHRPMPVYVNDLDGFNERQLETLGIGAASLMPLKADHHAGFRHRKLAYRLATAVVDHAYDLDYLKRRVRPAYVRLRSLLRGR